MRRTLPIVMLTAAALTTPAVAAAAKPTPNGTYTGTARSIDGNTAYGEATFTFKKGKLVTWAVEEVPRQCKDVEQMNYGFTVASNVLKAYGLTAKDVKTDKKGRLRFTYRQPSHTDAIKVDFTFGKKKAGGTLINTAGPGDPDISNCSGSARASLKK